MINNIFFTGTVGIGKSTALKRVLEEVNVSIGGFLTKKNTYQWGSEISITSLNNYNDTHIFARVGIGEDISEAVIDIDTFDTYAVEIIDKSLNSRDIIVMDELGVLENKAYKFQQKVYEAIDSEKLVLGILKQRESEFLDNIRQRANVKVIEVNEVNRDECYRIGIDILNQHGIELKKKDSYLWPQPKIDLYEKALSYEKNEYPDVFLEKIRSWIPNRKGKSALEIGAGTGAFSIEMAKEGVNVTALDSSYNMLLNLKRKAELNNVKNIECIVSPFHRADVEVYDFAVSAYSGNAFSEISSIQKLYSHINEYAFIICPATNNYHNFNGNELSRMLGRELKKFSKTVDKLLEDLHGLRYEYYCEEIEYNFPQIFDSYEESIDYFKKFFHIESEMETVTLKSFINKYITKEEDIFIFDNIKKGAFVVLKK